MKKKYKIQLIILYYSFANVIGISLGIGYRIYPDYINYIGSLLFLVFGTILILIQRKIVNKSRIDLS
ncbi:MAG: hypothetical protein AB9846_08410 [Tenuifilaceae bacterium]